MNAHVAALDSLREATGKPVVALDVAIALAVSFGGVMGLVAMQGATVGQLNSLHDIANDHYKSTIRAITEHECAGSA